MRLIIKEYIYQLQEKDELDFLLCDLYNQKGYIVDSKPKTGNRQYGVDIQMHNSKEILLFVVKQGNIDRKNWSENPNGVRASLEEIRDVYLHMMTPKELQKKIKIIVATNGDREGVILSNWNGYVKNNSNWNGKKVDISFCGIDDIVNMVYMELFNEHLFGGGIQSALRKALYFVGESDYCRTYYEKIIDDLFDSISSTNRPKEKEKLLSILYLSCEMMCQYASVSGVNKVSIQISEYLIIKYWKYLYCNNYFEKKKHIDWLLKFCDCYEKYNYLYYDKITPICMGEEMFPDYNVVENRVILYEVLGYLVAYASYLTERQSEKALEVLNSIILLLNAHPEFCYAPYDSDIGIIVSLYRLLVANERSREVKILMDSQAFVLMSYYQKYGKYPAPSDSFDEAIKIECNANDNEYETSGFWGYFLLCIVCMKYDELYNKLYSFLDGELGSVTKCVWFYKKEEEEKLYNYYAMNSIGEGLSIIVEKNYEFLEKKIKFVFEQYENETLSFDKFSFNALEIILSRYYGYVPRVTPKMLYVNDE